MPHGAFRGSVALNVKCGNPEFTLRWRGLARLRPELRNLMFNSVRIRLTLWYAGVLAVSLIAFALLVYYAAANVFYQRQDEALRSTAETVASAYMQELEEEQSISKANEVVLAEMVFPNRYVEVTDASGRAVAWSANLTGHVLAIPPNTLLNAQQQTISFAVINNLRVAVTPLAPD